ESPRASRGPDNRHFVHFGISTGSSRPGPNLRLNEGNDAEGYGDRVRLVESSRADWYRIGGCQRYTPALAPRDEFHIDNVDSRLESKDPQSWRRRNGNFPSWPARRIDRRSAEGVSR